MPAGSESVKYQSTRSQRPGQGRAGMAKHFPAIWGQDTEAKLGSHQASHSTRDRSGCDAGSVRGWLITSGRGCLHIKRSGCTGCRYLRNAQAEVPLVPKSQRLPKRYGTSVTCLQVFWIEGIREAMVSQKQKITSEPQKRCVQLS